MFGYVRIYKPELKIKDYEIYKAAYCSVCRALGRHYGVIARGLLSYDATFLYLYRAAISEAADCKYEKVCVRLILSRNAAIYAGKTKRLSLLRRLQ